MSNQDIDPQVRASMSALGINPNNPSSRNVKTTRAARIDESMMLDFAKRAAADPVISGAKRRRLSESGFRLPDELPENPILAAHAGFDDRLMEDETPPFMTSKKKKKKKVDSQPPPPGDDEEEDPGDEGDDDEDGEGDFGQEDDEEEDDSEGEEGDEGDDVDGDGEPDEDAGPPDAENYHESDQTAAALSIILGAVRKLEKQIIAVATEIGYELEGE